MYEVMTMMSARTELTTEEAADYLQVSRQFLFREMEIGRLRYRLMDMRRHVSIKDLEAYRQDVLAMQRKALNQLAENARELGLDY